MKFYQSCVFRNYHIWCGILSDFLPFTNWRICQEIFSDYDFFRNYHTWCGFCLEVFLFSRDLHIWCEFLTVFNLYICLLQMVSFWDSYSSNHSFRYLLVSNFLCRELFSSNYSSRDLFVANFPFWDLFSSNYPSRDLLVRNFPFRDLFHWNFPSRDLVFATYPLRDLFLQAFSFRPVAKDPDSSCMVPA